MPAGDRTGPAGRGPKTGRGLGPCATPGAKAPRAPRAGLGRGGAPRGGGGGQGRGKGRRKVGGVTYFT